MYIIMKSESHFSSQEKLSFLYFFKVFDSINSLLAIEKKRRYFVKKWKW